MSVTGDFGKLDVWSKLLVESDQLLEAMSAVLAEEFVDLVKQGFRSERDPYGKAWQKKQRPDGRKVLSGKTGILKNSWFVTQAYHGGFRISSTTNYWLYHQAPGQSGADGRRLTRPRRMQVPTKSRGLPPRWSKALQEAAMDTAQAYFDTAGSSSAPRNSAAVADQALAKAGLVRSKAARSGKGGRVRSAIRKAIGRAHSTIGARVLRRAVQYAARAAGIR